jgi:FkbM family methyltransferase
MSCIFTNDNNTTIQLIEHPFSQTFALRDNHEVLFRRMHTYLMKTGIIKNNIIDLGAWIGDNTIPWAKRIRSDQIRSVIYAIDPSQENCHFINEMCQHNQIDNVKIFQTAVSNKIEILSTNDDMYHCTFEPGVQGRNKVNAITLDYLFENREIENIGYIHLDVEGMEYKVILGANQIIDTCRPVITFEQHLELDNYDMILNHLLNKKYVVFLIDEVLPGCRPDCRNSIAFPEEIFNQSIVDGIHQYVGKEILLPF